MNKNLLIVFCKFPKIGFVKTRLSPPLSLEQAKNLYSAFLLDSLQQYLRLGIDLEICVDNQLELLDMKIFIGKELKINFEKENKSKINFSFQVGDMLGSRMKNALEAALNKGYSKVGIIGTDHPDLPSSYITQAYDILERQDLVFGEATDGGYYFIGINNSTDTKNLSKILSDDLPFSTSNLLAETILECKKLDLKFALLNRWYDIDVFEDLRKLYFNLNDNSPQTRVKSALEGIKQIFEE